MKIDISVFDTNIYQLQLTIDEQKNEKRFIKVLDREFPNLQLAKKYL